MFNIMLNLGPNHFYDCLVVEGFLASENLRAMDSNLWAFSTNLCPVAHVLPRKALITSSRVDLLNWNLALHCWLTLRGTTGSVMGKSQGMRRRCGPLCHQGSHLWEVPQCSAFRKSRLFWASILGLFLMGLRLVGLFIIFSALATRR